MGIHQYRTAQRQAESPQQSEYRVLAEVTRRLMEIDDVKAPAAVQALYDNAAVWGTFAADVSMPENPLPDALKAQILSLYLWVERHSRQVGRGGAKIQPLVDVNKAVMAGLAAQASAAGGAPGQTTAGATAYGAGQGAAAGASPAATTAPPRPGFLDSV